MCININLCYELLSWISVLAIALKKTNRYFLTNQNKEFNSAVV